MRDDSSLQGSIPSWQLYGEHHTFPDLLHCEQISDRAAGLDWRISPHRHAYLHQFLLIRKGRFKLLSNEEPRSLEAPCILSIPRGFVHGFAFSAETEGYVVTVPLQTLPEVFAPQTVTASTLSRLTKLNPSAEIEAVFEQIHQEHGARWPARSALLRAYASILAIEIARKYQGDARQKSVVENPLFWHFEDMVAEQYKNGWRVKAYADAMGISTRHLGRLCREAKGQSPTEYIENVVMQEACRLLVYTRSSVAAIGYQLGFDDPAYFSRVFRRCWDISPSTYRAQFEAD